MRRAFLIAGLLALVLFCGGCKVVTTVSLTDTADGHGTVAVTVSLDKSAVAAIGGESALASQLSDADLRAAGWTVVGPRAGAGGTTVLSASHPFSSLSEAGDLVSDLAGQGPSSERPFRLVLSHRSSFWHTDTTLSGTVALSCGLNCFGDSGLSAAVGSPVGVNERSLEAQAGQQPDQVFSFNVVAKLPGSLVHSNGAVEHDGQLEWTPRLGHDLVLSAESRTLNTSSVIGVAIAAGAVVVAAVAFVGWRWRRRRRRRRIGAHSAGRRT